MTLTMTLTDEQYAETIAAVKRGDQTSGTFHVYRWCDGSTACVVESEPHGHWRGGYTVDGTEVLRRLLAENERLRAEAKRADEEATKLANSDLATTEQVIRGLRAENARLIAAAPDLLAACEAVAATTWSKNTATIIGEQVRAAIAKAKGETP